MADKSKIEWTDATWGPVVGCTKVSDGCTNCYAEPLVNRFAGTSKAFPNRFDVVTLRPWMLDLPLTWRKPRLVFVNSLADLFHDDVPADYIADVFAVMAATPRHTYQVLTKRHGRMRSLLRSEAFREQVARAADARGQFTVALERWPLPNVWLGVSVEDQQWADIRIPALLDTPAAVRFLSVEPMLGPVNLRRFFACGQHREVYADDSGPCPDCYPMHPPIGWVIVGGESGAQHRPFDLAWARRVRDDCLAAGVPFLFKQVGGRTSKSGGRELDGRTYDEYPEGHHAAAT